MAQILNRIGQLGLGIAVVGGVVNSALYNGMKIFICWMLILNSLEKSKTAEIQF